MTDKIEIEQKEKVPLWNLVRLVCEVPGKSPTQQHPFHRHISSLLKGVSDFIKAERIISCSVIQCSEESFIKSEQDLKTSSRNPPELSLYLQDILRAPKYQLLTRMYVSRRKCEVVLAVAKLTARLLGCGTGLHTSQQPYLYFVLGLRYGLFTLFRWLLGCSGWLLGSC